MKKVLSMVLAAMMLLSLCSFAAAEDVVELEFVYHKTESNAIDAMENNTGEKRLTLFAGPASEAPTPASMSPWCMSLTPPPCCRAALS